MASLTKDVNNNDHAFVLNKHLAGSLVVGVGVDAKGDLVIEFPKYVLRLYQGQKFELMTADSIVKIDRPNPAVQ